MATIDLSVEELVSKIERGELRLPEMQRQYVWKATRVRDLMDSLYRQYPSGSILMWETDAPVAERSFAVEQGTNPHYHSTLLLDGQQRLTSLTAILRGQPLTVRGRKKAIDLMFNLDYDEQVSFVTEVTENGGEEGEDEVDVDADEVDSLDEDLVDEDEVDASQDEKAARRNKMPFAIYSKALDQQPNWIRVSEVMQSNSDGPIIKRAGVKDLDDPRYEKYQQRLARLRKVRDYRYRVDILERSLSYDEVTEIFVRVNSLGVKLRGSDLALAQLTAKWPTSLKEFEGFVDEVANKHHFPLEMGLILRNLVVFASGQCRFKVVSKLPLADVRAAWTDACEGMRFAIDFIRNNAGIDDPSLLSSPLLLIAIAKFGHLRHYKLSPSDDNELRTWALLANAKGRHSRGQTETILDQDIKSIHEGGNADHLLVLLRNQVSTLAFTEEELEGKDSRSAIFKTMFLAFRKLGATDWRTSMALGVRHAKKSNKLHAHHIFPKNVLKSSYQRRQVDDIANLAFIGSQTNQWISDRPPSAYIPDLLKEGKAEALAAQAVPGEQDLLTIDRYPQFLVARRKMIIDILNDLIN